MHGVEDINLIIVIFHMFSDPKGVTLPKIKFKTCELDFNYLDEISTSQAGS